MTETIYDYMDLYEMIYIYIYGCICVSADTCLWLSGLDWVMFCVPDHVGWSSKLWSEVLRSRRQRTCDWISISVELCQLSTNVGVINWIGVKTSSRINHLLSSQFIFKGCL